ncbi:MAG: LysR substrate-binding domain-containing protein [Pseudomonadota bacterium]|nr:LysR substrate-binding domain-containing protein [Pseudomonadota bacterium]
MNLRDLKYLVALMDHKHFGRAAEACFVSQPTLSTQIKKLEDELGVVLVERNPRHVMLTDVGVEIASRARLVLDEVNQMRELARRTRDPEAGTVRLGIFPTLAPYLLPHVIPQVRRRFPKLLLLLTEEKTEELLRRVRDGRLDAAVVALPIGDATLHEEFLFEERFLLAMPEDHPLSRQKRIVAADLEDQQLLLLEDGHCLRDQALAVCRLSGADEHSGFRATSLETLRQMVGSGVGITLLPALSVQPPVAPMPGLKLLRFSDNAPSRRIALVWRRSSAFAPFLTRLAKVLAQVPKPLLAGLAAPQ